MIDTKTMEMIITACVLCCGIGGVAIGGFLLIFHGTIISLRVRK